MKNLIRTVAMLVPFAFAAAITAAQAENASTMTCYSGSVAVITLPITGINFDLPTGSPMGYFTATAAFSEFNTLAVDHYDYPTMDSCSFSPGNGTSVYNITISDVAAHSDAVQQYSQITLSYTTISIGPEAAKLAIPAPKTRPTDEQKQKALADYLTRLPKPSPPSK